MEEVIIKSDKVLVFALIQRDGDREFIATKDATEETIKELAETYMNLEPSYVQMTIHHIKSWIESDIDMNMSIILRENMHAMMFI